MNTHTLRKHAGVLLLFTLFALITFFPAEFDEPLGSNPQDSLTFMWNFWWVEKAFREGLPLFQTNFLFYPGGINMAYTDLSLVNTIPGIFIAKLSDGIVAFNVLVFLTLILGAYTMFLLLEYLTNNAYVAILGGYLYSFGPWHVYKVNSSLIWASIEFVPLFVLFLFKTTEQPTLKNALWMSAFLVLTFYASIPFAFVMVLFSLMYVGYLIVTRHLTKNLLKKLVIAAVLFTLLVSPILVKMAEAHGDYIATTNAGANLVEYGRRTTSHAFLPGRASKAIMGISAMFWAVLGIVFLFRTKRREAWLWCTSLGLFFVLTLGDYGIKIGKYRLLDGVAMPAYFLRLIPPLNSFDFTKINFVMVFITSILAAYGLRWILDWVRKKQDWKTTAAFFVVLFLLIALDTTTLVQPSDRSLFSEKRMDAYERLAERGTKSDVVLDLPVATWMPASAIYKPETLAARNMIAQTIHQKHIMSGYRSRIPEEINKRRHQIYTYDLDQLKQDVDFIVVHKTFVFPQQVPNSAYDCTYDMDPKGKAFIEKVMATFAPALFYEDNALMMYDLSLIK